MASESEPEEGDGEGEGDGVGGRHRAAWSRHLQLPQESPNWPAMLVQFGKGRIPRRTHSRQVTALTVPLLWMRIALMYEGR
jgi:hypothetical protein